MAKKRVAITINIIITILAIVIVVSLIYTTPLKEVITKPFKKAVSEEAPDITVTENQETDKTEENAEPEGPTDEARPMESAGESMPSEESASDETANEETEEQEQTESSDEENPEEPVGALSLLDFDYEIIETDLVKVNSITYNIQNTNIGTMNLELLIYIYDENDDDSKKGLVRDQISIGRLNFRQSITDTVSVNANYRGNLATEKTIKITLIANIKASSYNIDSASQEVVFE